MVSHDGSLNIANEPGLCELQRIYLRLHCDGLNMFRVILRNLRAFRQFFRFEYRGGILENEKSMLRFSHEKHRKKSSTSDETSGVINK